MSTKKRILLKLTGELFLAQEKDQKSLEHVIEQISSLRATHQFGIVVGGGNFFRGKTHAQQLSIGENTAHTVGMLATMMNGLIAQEICQRHGLKTTLFSALFCPTVAESISPQNLKNALSESDTLIFCGGTGNPFFTTDTTAVIRALQINADEIWKATKVDGIYSANPHEDTHARLLKTVSYQDALAQNLSVMDGAAFSLAREYNQRIRIFNIFTRHAILTAAKDTDFGSSMHT